MVGTEPHPEKPSFVYYVGFGSSIVATVLISVVAFTTTSTDIGDFLSKVLGPLAALVAGGWTADFYHRRDANKKIERDVGNAVYSARSLFHGVLEVDRRLADATNALAESDYTTATKNLEAAIARTNGNLLSVLQSLREWESLSHIGAQRGATNFEIDVETIQQRRERMFTPNVDVKSTAACQSSRWTPDGFSVLSEKEGLQGE